MKKIFIIIVVLFTITITNELLSLFFNKTEDTEKVENNITNTIALGNSSSAENVVVLNENEEVNIKYEKQITDWRLVLVNYEHELPENFEVELANIDTSRQFDSRAIEYLKQMQIDMKKDGVTGAWIQSAFRSVDYQNELYNQKVKEFMSYGLSEEDAKERTSKLINKPETSEHNLGLAVDFNYVDLEFEETKAFKWLEENAENYGFILRYRKDKEDITKVSYEPWHWRFVGEEHAKKINELNMCLEEYIEYLKNTE